MVCKKYDKSYEDIQPSNNASIHQKNTNISLFKFFKFLMRLNPEFLWFCDYKNPILCDLKKESKLFLPSAKSFCYRYNYVDFKGNISYSNLPSWIKNSQALNEFELKLKDLGNIQGTSTMNR